MDLLTMYKIKAFLGTAYDSETTTFTYNEIGEGFDNVSEALNEVVQQYFFLNKGGFANNHVTGMAPAWTFTGRRVQGDAVQDYIFSKKYALSKERQSGFKLVITDNTGEAPVEKTLTVPCTLCNIQEFSGATTDDAAISVEIRFDGRPEIQ